MCIVKNNFHKIIQKYYCIFQFYFPLSFYPLFPIFFQPCTYCRLFYVELKSGKYNFFHNSFLCELESRHFYYSLKECENVEQNCGEFLKLCKYVLREAI